MKIDKNSKAYSLGHKHGLIISNFVGLIINFIIDWLPAVIYAIGSGIILTWILRF